MNNIKLHLIAFTLWLVLAICWTVFVVCDFKRGNASTGQIIMHVLFMFAAFIMSFAEYKKHKNYKE